MSLFQLTSTTVGEVLLLHGTLRGNDKNALVLETAMLDTKYESSIPK